jgi:hypothetical protein
MFWILFWVIKKLSENDDHSHNQKKKEQKKVNSPESNGIDILTPKINGERRI